VQEEYHCTPITGYDGQTPNSRAWVSRRGNASEYAVKASAWGGVAKPRSWRLGNPCPLVETMAYQSIALKSEER